MNLSVREYRSITNGIAYPILLIRCYGICWGVRRTLSVPSCSCNENNSYRLKDEFSTQRQVEQYFEGLEKNEQNERIKEILYELISNVILFEEEDKERTGISLQDCHGKYEFLQIPG